MPRRPISYCDVNDCDLRVAGRGLCRKHYWRMRLTGTTDDPTPPRNQSPCAVDDCGLAAILADLIAELRDRHTPRDGLCNYCWSCDRCPVPWPCPDSLAADRAEARLREVQGE